MEYREGLYVGCRYFETAKVLEPFPFGFGLSYTTFEYSDLKVSDTEATFTLKNTGKMDGAEAAQLYVSVKDTDTLVPYGMSKLLSYAKGDTKNVSDAEFTELLGYWAILFLMVTGVSRQAKGANLRHGVCHSLSSFSKTILRGCSVTP